MAEALVRNLNNFSRFLTTTSLCNAEQVNYPKIAADAPKMAAKSYLLPNSSSSFGKEQLPDQVSMFLLRSKKQGLVPLIYSEVLCRTWYVPICSKYRAMFCQ